MPQHIRIDQDLIDELQTTPECTAFFERVLGRSTTDCLLTDDSALSDFAGGGPGAPDPKGLTYGQYLDAWDAWVFKRVRDEFGIELKTTNIRLVELIPLLQRGKAAVH